MKNILILLAAILSFAACEIREEYTFNEDGSGVYEMAFDFTEFMNSTEANDSTAFQEQVDTVINFASLLYEKRDSIAQLPEDEQRRLRALEPLEFSMKVNDSTKQMLMKLRYEFSEIEDLEHFAEAVEQANIKELNELSGASQPGDTTELDSLQPAEPGLFEMASSFNMKFSSRKFKRTITDEARLRAVETKDTTMTAEDPFADMIKFKQVFRFPYRIREVDNENARILSDFKGIEFEANMYDINNNPDFFNIEVLFEK
ncbi:MAG: hypothetical protein ACR2MM_07915 [Flavobacteriaceae bacterium]